MSGDAAVIVVDDEELVRDAAKQALELAGYRALDFAGAEPVSERISGDWNGVVVTDVKMPGMDGLELLRQCLEKDRELPVVLITGHGDISMAVEAMRDGAYDFIEKPFRSDHLVEVVRRALEKRHLVLENRSLRANLGQTDSALIGDSPAMQQVRKTIAAIADTEASVLIFGETGTGKELVARGLHQHSARRENHFVAINCGAVPESIIESELFGHEAGAFTDAKQRRLGKFEYASSGTLFLDEIESTSTALQVRLLRVLQEREIERLGSNEPIPVDVRVVAASKADLKTLATRGEFREDLYYRLDVVELQLPPLRARREDIPLLFQHFILAASARYQREPRPVSRSSLQRLMAHEWPGNVRELRNVAERFVLFPDLDVFETLSEPVAPAREPNITLPEQLAEIERTLIIQELSRCAGDINATHQALGIGRKTLYEKMQKYGLDRKAFQGQTD